jgi:hypothetical protein
MESTTAFPILTLTQNIECNMSSFMCHTDNMIIFSYANKLSVTWHNVV